MAANGEIPMAAVIGAVHSRDSRLCVLLHLLLDPAPGIALPTATTNGNVTGRQAIPVLYSAPSTEHRELLYVEAPHRHIDPHLTPS